jgi:hypothetical protein
MDAVDRKRDHAPALLRVQRSEDPDSLHLGQALERIRGELLLVGADAVHADRRQVVHGGAQAHALGDRRGARLELPGQLVPGRGVELDLGDHVAAAQERPHRFEQLTPAMQHADAGGAKRLVPGPGIEVGADRGYVERQLGGGL